MSEYESELTEFKNFQNVCFWLGQSTIRNCLNQNFQNLRIFRMCVFGLDKVPFVYFSIRCTQESKLKFGRTQESKLKFGSRRLAAAAGV